MRLQLRSLVAAMALLLTASGLAQAIDITFDLSGLTNGPTATITSGAYSLNLLNPVNSGINTGSFFFDSDGVWVGLGSGPGGPVPYNAGFDMSVTGGSLQFKSYKISYIDTSTEGTFSLLGGTGTSTGNKLNPAGTYTFAGTKIISPGDTVSLSGTITSGALSEIKSITFSTVPEPSTYALGAIATGVMAAIARRRKARKA